MSIGAMKYSYPIEEIPDPSTTAADQVTVVEFPDAGVTLRTVGDEMMVGLGSANVT